MDRPDRPPLSGPARELPSTGEKVSGWGLGAVPSLISSPSTAFRRLAVDPQWLGAFLLFLVLVGIGAAIRLPQDIALGYEITETSMQKLGLGAEAIDQALARLPDPENIPPTEVASRVAQTVIIMGALGFLGVLVIWLIARLMGPQAGFRQAATVLWTAQLAAGLGYLLLAVAVRMADSVEVSLGPAALFPGLEWGSLPYLFLEIFNVFSLVTLYLLAVGSRWIFGVAKGTGWAIGGTYWAIVALVGFASQAGFSYLAGRL